MYANTETNASTFTFYLKSTVTSYNLKYFYFYLSNFLQNYFYFYLSKNNLKYLYFYLSTNVNYFLQHCY